MGDLDWFVALLGGWFAPASVALAAAPPLLQLVLLLDNCCCALHNKGSRLRLSINSRSVGRATCSV